MTSGSCIFVIVDRGKAGALLHRAQQIGASRGTIFLGEGTMPSRLLDFFGVASTQKEVLLIAVPDAVVEPLYGLLREEFQLHKKYKGIAFSVPYLQYQPDHEEDEQLDRSRTSPYVCLMTVIERGLGEECMRHARDAGARGGTILHAHGAGVPQDFFFPLMVEPQKDILLIVTPRDDATRIREWVYQKMQLEKKGAGIVFGMPVTRTLGLYQERQQERQGDQGVAT